MEKKKFITFCIALIMMGWNLSINAQTYSGGNGTEVLPYEIANKTDLKYLSENNSDWDEHFLQTANIVFEPADFAAGGAFYNVGAGFSPIGNDTTNFTGSYNGNNLSITGLYTNRPNQDCVGMFGLSTGEIKNLKLENVKIIGKYCTGGLVGISGYCSISNCQLSGTICGYNNVGGLVGIQYFGIINTCSATGTVEGQENVGGLAGANVSWDLKSYAPSANNLVNNLNSLTEKNGDSIIYPDANGNFSKTPNIETTFGDMVGRQDMISNLLNKSMAVNRFTDINKFYLDTDLVVRGGKSSKLGYYNIIGTIINCNADGTVSGQENVGGLVGNNLGSIYKSHTSAAVSGVMNVGGLAGRNDNFIIYSFARGDVFRMSGNEVNFGGFVGEINGTIHQCYSTGMVSGDGWIPTNKGFAGSKITGVCSDNYWDILSSGQSASAGQGSGEIEGKNTSEMKQQATFVNWDFTNTWAIDPSKNNGYPYPIGNNYSGGTGTPESPYLIANKYDLKYLSENSSDLDKHFLQTADIAFDLADFEYGGLFYNNGIGFIPIGIFYYSCFTGSYNGNSHSIKGLYINKPWEYCTGMFGCIDSDFEIKNIELKDVDITGEDYVGGLCGAITKGSIKNCKLNGSIIGETWVGGLIGAASDTVSISNCQVDVDIVGEDYVGGLIGTASDTDSISNCQVDVDIVGEDFVGGLIGYTSDTVSISNCQVDVDILGGAGVGGLIGVNSSGKIISCSASGKVSGSIFAGGLVGFNGGSISKCFTSAAVSGTGLVGGFAGNNISEISDSYARGNIFRDADTLEYFGGFAGITDDFLNLSKNTSSTYHCYATGTVSGEGWNPTNKGFTSTVDGGILEHNYWDTLSSGQTSSAGQGTGQIEGKSTSQMMQQATFGNWNFDSIWIIDPLHNNGYPYLQWQSCFNPTNGGSISESQNICQGETPEALTETTVPSGEMGIIEYKWQFFTVSDTIGFEDIPNSNTANYSPGVLPDTTWFRRLARVDCMPGWSGAAQSNVIKINIIPETIAFAGNDASVLPGEDFTLLEATADNYSSLCWTTSGDGIFDDSTNLNPTYTPGTNDFVAGNVVLTLTLEGLGNCNFTDNAQMTLTIFGAPSIVISSPTEDEIIYDTVVTVSGTASDAGNNLSEIHIKVNNGTWQLATGTNAWTGILSLMPGENLIQAKALNTLGLESIIAEVNIIASYQLISLTQGWSLISSYLDPADPDLVNLWADVVSENNLLLMIGMNGIYAPAPFNINTMINWDVLKGYKIKMNAPDELVIKGYALSENTVNFAAGAHIVPMLTNQSALLLDIFDNPENDILYMLDLTSNLVYWPGGDIYTLNELIPGRGYLANFLNPVTLSFPNLSKGAKSVNQVLPPAEGPWACARTGNLHLISISTEAINNLEKADYLGAFDNEGNCVGYAAIGKTGENILLTVYGNDETSAEKDGLEEGELLRFRSFSRADNTETELAATFSESFASHDGLYATDGLSAISGFKASATGIVETEMANSIQVYPNPASDELNIVFDNFKSENETQIELVNSGGSMVLKSNILQKHSKLDLGNLQPGIYVLKIIQDGEMTYKKVVLR